MLTCSATAMWCSSLLGLASALSLPAALAAGPGTNLDTRARALMPPAWQPLDYDAVSKRAYIGFRKTLAVLDLLDPAQPRLLGTLDLDRPLHSIDHSGNHVFVAAESAGLISVDVSDPTHPSIVGSAPTTDAMFGVSVVGTLAYVAHGNLGLTIHNVANPSNPTLVGTSDPAGHAYGVAVHGTRAYLCYGPEGIHVIDVSNPASPVSLGEYDTDFAWSAAVAGTTAYVADGFEGVKILDVADPANPILVGSHPGTRVREVRLQGELLYAADREGSVLQILDVSDRAAPEVVSVFDTPGLPWTVRVAGSIAVVGDDWEGLTVLDVAYPAAPRVIGSWRAAYSPTHVAHDGRYAFIADAGRGLIVVDQIDLAAPRVVAFLETPGTASDVFVRDGYAYLADGNALRVIDVHDPTSPSIVGAISGLFTAGADVWVEGNYAYVANQNDGIFIINITNPTQPLLAGSNHAPGLTEDIVVRNGIAYVADGAAGMMILDVSNPAATSVLSSVDPDGQFDGNAVAVAVMGPWAYLADQLQQQIDVIQINDPARPRSNNQVNVAGRPSEILVAGDTLVLAAGDGGLRFYDRGTIPNLPIEVASLPFDQDAAASQGVGFRSGYAWIVDPNDGGYLARYTGQCRDAFEPNDHPDFAAPIPAGTPQVAKICDQTDRDLFAAAVTSGGTLNVSMTPPPGRNYDLFAYDPSRTPIGSSSGGGPGQSESLALTVIDPGAYQIEIRGANEADYASASSYTLSYTFAACPAPPLEVQISAVRLNGAGDVELTIVDTNPSTTVTGYNVYRANAAAGPFVRVATNATDADSLRPGIQLIDAGSVASAPLFYRAAAFNGVCGGEGPR